MAEDTSPATKVEAFLRSFGNADQQDLERASSAVRKDQSAWEAAGRRVGEIVAVMGLGDQKRDFCRKAAGIFEGKAAQIQPGDRQYALWAAQGVIVGLLAGDSAKSTDLRVLKMPFLQLLRETPIRAPRETPIRAPRKNGYCENHPTVPLRYGHCQACDDEKRYPPRW